MAKTPKYARYNWVPVSVTLGLTAAAIFAGQMTGGHHNTPSNGPNADTMPYFAVPHAVGNPEDAKVPAAAETISAWVCRGFVFVDSAHNEVIVNPLVDNESQQPLHFIGATATSVAFDKPEAHDSYILYRYTDGKLIQDEDGRLNRCYGSDPVTAVHVDDQSQSGRYILADPATKVHEGDDVDNNPEAALREGVVHADFDMEFKDIQAFVTGMGA
jgi:hypothetical protein